MASEWERVTTGADDYHDDEGEEDELLPYSPQPKRPASGGGLLVTCCCCAVLAAIVTAAAIVGRGLIAGAAGSAEGDNPVRLTSWMVDGVRFSPAGITLRSTGCEPFSMDPNATTRAALVQRPLTAASARPMASSAREHAGRSMCSYDVCVPRPPTRVFHLQNVCLHNETFYLLSDRDAPAVVLMDDWWGDPKDRTGYKRYLREVRREADVPGTKTWLRHSWVIASPRFRFGLSNIFHSILEEVGWFGRAMSCGRVAASAETRYLLMHRRRLLGRNTVGRLWEIATGGVGSYFIPQAAAASAFCFERLHVESEGGALEPMAAMCAHVAALHPKGPHEWPGWPAADATFVGFASIVEKARARLGLRPALVAVEAEAAAGAWAAPRVTVVHRLKNRKLVNVAFLVRALRDAAFDVTVVSLECMPLEAQLAVVSNSSTLLGVHGAGLTLGHALPQDALVLELRSAPCTEEARGVPYQMRRRNRIIAAPHDAVGPQVACPPPWKYNSREMDAVVDIGAVMSTIFAKDVIASSAAWAARRAAYAAQTATAVQHVS